MELSELCTFTLVHILQIAAAKKNMISVLKNYKNCETQISPLPDHQCNQSPVLVHHVGSGLGQLCQVGQHRTQVVELSLLVVTFSTEDVHQLCHTNPVLEELKQQTNTSSLTIQHLEHLSTRSACSEIWWSQAV